MGTRSITTVRSQWAKEQATDTHANIYRHWDGYLEEHGQWLYDFLNGLQVVNGIGVNMPKRYANGPGRLAAQLVAQLLADGHEPDLMPPDVDCGQEYHYVIDVIDWGKKAKIRVTVYSGPMTFFGYGGEECTKEIFKGTVAAFGKFLKQQAEVE